MEGFEQTQGAYGAPDGADFDKTPRKRSRIAVFLEYVIILTAAVAMAFFVRTFLVEPFMIPTASMDPTIVVGDYVLTEKYDIDPQYGDIVTFTDPEDLSRTLIKRVIATGGQTVDLVDGTVYVDGVALSEPYTFGKLTEPLSQHMAGVAVSYPYTVPEGYVWVMGDNRTNSSDSRYFGAIPVDSVTGEAFFTYWPVSHMGTLG